MTNINDETIATSLVQDLLQEKRADRRWKNIRFIFWFLLIACIVTGIFRLCSDSSVSKAGTGEKYTALIRLNGMIAPGRGVSAEEIIPILQDAFADRSAKGLIIDINSPGGTPVQAAIIHDAIITLKKKYHKKVVIVGEDLLTSGAYYIAVSADRIYVNPNTITGSIGVIVKGFGFVDLMKKVGIERRVYTAGDNKDRLDPFLPQNPDDLKKIQQVMTEVHQNFVKAVLEGRKNKLRASPETLFNGDFWSGDTALKIGLVDGLGNLMDVMEKEFGTTKYKEFGGAPAFLRMLSGPLNNVFDSMFYLYN